MSSINFQPNSEFIDSLKYLIIDKMEENYPVIVHFVCDKPWKSSCNMENEGKNKEIWNNLYAKPHKPAIKKKRWNELNSKGLKWQEYSCLFV